MRSVLAAIVLVALGGISRAGDTCQVDGRYGVRSKTTVDGKRVVGLVATRWPNGAPVLEVIAESAGGASLLTTGYLDEHAPGRWRATQQAVEDQPRVNVRLKRCERFVGRIKAPGKRGRRIVAQRVRCGDGHVDRFAGEDCDTSGEGCFSGTCNDRCRCQGSGGRVDETFGVGGVATIYHRDVVCSRVFCGQEGVSSIRPRPDGTVIVTGFSDTWLFNPVETPLLRLRADGSVDPAFPSVAIHDGLPPRPITSGFHSFGTLRIAPMADGRLVFAQGLAARDGFTGDLARRLLPDGAPDPSFALNLLGAGSVDDVGSTLDGGILTWGGGRLTHRHADGTLEEVEVPPGWNPFAVDDTGRILAFSIDAAFRVQRFTPLGSPDPTFAGGNAVCVTLMRPDHQFEAVRQLDDDSVVVGLRTSAGLRITHVPRDGIGFDSDCGSEPESFAAAAVPHAVQPDGKYLAIPSEPPCCQGDAVRGRLLRFFPDGTPDLQFADRGSFDLAQPITAVAVDAQGRILVGTSWRPALEQPLVGIAVQRLLP